MNKKTAAKAAVVNTSEKTSSGKTTASTEVVKPLNVVGKELQSEVNSEQLKKEVLEKAVKETKDQLTEKVKQKTETVGNVAAEVYIQYTNEQATLKEVIEAVKEEYVAMGHHIETLKSLQIYLKPEEYKAYYVINKKMAGSVPLFQ